MALAHAISGNTTLVVLDCRANQMGLQGGAEFTTMANPALQVLNHIPLRSLREQDYETEELDLSGAELEDGDGVLLSWISKSCPQSLTTVNISSNPDMGPEGIDVLVHQLPTQRALTSLDLSDTGMTGTTGQQQMPMMTLGLHLSTNRVLTTLRLAGNMLTGEYSAISPILSGWEALMKGLRKNRCLRVLDVARNGLGPEGVMMLADVLLTKGVALEEVNLSNNCITNTSHNMRGVEAIATVIEHSRTLRSLDLSSNQLCGTSLAPIHTGVEILTDAIAGSRSLEWIQLEGNFIGIDQEEELKQVADVKRIGLGI
jgi:Ran GTPase-activating protein (RanGAP) involved in mRNA processing and transport